ncbi:MAG: hypothetical protein ABI651_13175, partial [Verrucomicrobiota bacterium]
MKRLWRIVSLAAIVALTSFLLRQPCHAAQRDFVLAGVKITLNDVSDQADVFFQSMRLNRSLNVWNVDVSVLNKSGQPLEGPLVLLVDSFTGTTGAQSPDGLADNQPAKAFFDFTRTLTNGKLLPGERSTKRPLVLGFQAGGSPKLTVKVFARAALSETGLNLVRTLNAFGQPLPSVLVEDVSSGARLTGAIQTDEAFGLATLTQTNPIAAIRFSEDGFLPVWRIIGATSNGVGVIPSPRLTRRDNNIATFKPIAGGALTRGNPPIEVKFTPGSFSADTAAQLTPLTSQTLPLLLPQGWSPLGAFWLELARRYRGNLDQRQDIEKSERFKRLQPFILKTLLCGDSS